MKSQKLLQIAIILCVGIFIAISGTVMVLRFAPEREVPTTTLPTENAQTVITAPTEPSHSVPRETVPMGGNSVITTVTGQKPQWKIEEEISMSVSASIAQSKAEATKKTQQNKTTKPYSGIVPQNKASVIASFQKGINNLKSTKNFTLQKDGGMNITVDDITGGYIVKQTVDALISQKETQTPESYTFKKGTDKTAGVTPTDVIMPFGENLKLKESAVLSATARATADGGYTAVIKLKDESQSSTSEAKYHGSIVPSVNPEELFSYGAYVDEYSLLYSGTTVTALFDKNNRITYLEYYVSFPYVEGSGTISRIPFTFLLHGEYVEQYDISY